MLRRASQRCALAVLGLAVVAGTLASCKPKGSTTPTVQRPGQSGYGAYPVGGYPPGGYPPGSTGGVVNSGGAYPPPPGIGTQGEEEQLTYPTLMFKSKGEMTYNGAKYSLQQDVTADMDAGTLRINTVKFSSNTSQVNDEVKKKVGIDVFVRVPKDQLVAAAQSGSFRNETFIVFSREVRKKNGKMATFTTPVPAFIVPAKRNRYESLDQGPITYNSIVTADAASASVVFTISKGALPAKIPQGVNPADLYAVQVDMQIPQDTSGKIYELLPMPRSATYVVDTNRKAVIMLQSVSQFHNSDAKKMETLTLNYGLCTSTNNGQVTSFPCQQ